MNPLIRPSFLLRAEGLAALAAACFAYQRFCAGHWGLFAALFLAPDVSLLAWLTSRGGFSAGTYNAFHSYVAPVALGMAAIGGAPAWVGQIALIWIAHIGFDRLLGYGLKYPGEFRRTHLQRAAGVI
jgi:hypothetical protein